jgi:membrane complex biogenesis BtpA family protein
LDVVLEGEELSLWIRDLFSVNKPVIALLHIRALPGDPLFCGDMRQVSDTAREEVCALQEGGVDGILFANEFSLPYQKHADAVTVAAMGYLIGLLQPFLRVPFGVNVVTNPLASVDLAAATGASFIRSAFTGAYLSEAGIVDTDVANTVRRKHHLGIKNLRMLYKVNPESDCYLAPRDLDLITRSIVFHCAPDGLCVSGSAAGAETSEELLDTVRANAKDIPVFCNTGCTKENIAEKLKHCDGALVGTDLKAHGRFEGTVEVQRVFEFMEEVRRFRQKENN